MQPDKKQIEVLLINYFKSCYNEFPEGEIMPSESPDFLLEMNNKHHLGIELTRLNPCNALPISDADKSEIQHRELLIKKVRVLFEGSSHLNLFVKFLFSEKKKMAREGLAEATSCVVNTMHELLRNKTGESFFKVSLPKSRLPDGLAQVVVIYHPEMETSVWERSNNLGVSNDVLDDIEKAIVKKDKKLKLYQKQHLNYYWLLITTDRLRGIKSFNLSNKILNNTFESSFQHVFLFDLIKSKVYKLV